MKASGGLNEGGWFENNSSWKVGNGKVVRLWNYKWGGTTTNLCVRNFQESCLTRKINGVRLVSWEDGFEGGIVEKGVVRVGENYC